MIKAYIFRNKDGDIYGFEIKNHGLDIVCSAVSILALNTVNSIEAFTERDFNCKYEEDGGFLFCEVPLLKEGKKDNDVSLLFNSLLLGLKGIEKMYSKYIKVFD